MKKIFKILLPIVAATLVACAGGGGSGGEPSGTLPLSVNVPAGENPVQIKANSSRIFKISGGRTLGGADGKEKRSYLVNVDESGVVALAWGKVGDKDVEDIFQVIWLDGPKETKVTVRDADDKQVSFYVKTDPAQPVNLYTTAPPGLVVGVGAAAARTFTIGGGNPPYRVVGSDANVARVELVGKDQFKITGIAIGQANIDIFDAKGLPINVAFEVNTPDLRVAPTDLSIFIGMTAVVKISGGQPPYRVAEGIPAAIKAEVVGDELRLTGLLLSEMEGITVIDAAGKFAPPVSVKVIPGTGSIRVSPNNSIVSETDNQNLNFTVLGAVAGEICFFSSDPSLLKPRIDAADATKTCVTSVGPTTPLNFTVETGSQGNRCVSASTDVAITVVDAARSTGEAVVTILDNGADCGLGVFSVSPRVLNMTGSSTAEVKVIGVTDFTKVAATTANAAIATAVVDQLNGVVRIKSAGPGTTTVLVTEDTVPRRSATVTVNVQ